MSFYVTAVAIFLAMNAYIGWRLVPTSALPRKWAVVAWSGVAVLAVTPPLLFLAGRITDGPAWLEDAFALGWVLFGLVIILLPAVLFRDGVAAVIGIARLLRTSEVQPQRRLFLRRMLNLGTLGVGGTAFGYGVEGAIHPPGVKRVSIPLTGLPDDFVGYTIAQLSDTHVSATVRRPEMQALVETVNSLGADLIAFTGDLVDGHVVNRRDDVAPIAELSAPDGVFFVTGNHDYYWDTEGWLQEIRRHGLTVLENEHRVIERDGSQLVIAGVPDISLKPTGSDPWAVGSDPTKALHGSPENAAARILLAHQPRSAFAAQKAGFDFLMCGHTHGGQVFPWTMVMPFVQPFVKGLGKLRDMTVYVNPGSMYWGPPMRLGTRSEVTLFTLTR